MFWIYIRKSETFKIFIHTSCYVGNSTKTAHACLSWFNNYEKKQIKMYLIQNNRDTCTYTRYKITVNTGKQEHKTLLFHLKFILIVHVFRDHRRQFSIHRIFPHALVCDGSRAAYKTHTEFCLYLHVSAQMHTFKRTIN